MQKAENHWYVLTGGPCAGKTTLILELERRGHHVIHEAARLIIEEELAEGKTLEEIRRPPGRFERRVVERNIAHEKGLPSELTVFLDRGILDNVAYHRYLNIPMDAQLEEAATAARYRKVFLLDMVDFEQDEARNETPEQASAIHEHLAKAYEEYGVPLVRVPVLPVPERAEFILKNL